MKLDSLKVKTKLSLNIGSLVVLLLIISFVSYIGVSTLISLIDKSKKNQDVATLMKDKEIDHLNWTNAVLQAMTSGKIMTAQIETNYHKCGLGKWYYSDDRKKAEESLPDIKEILKDIENPHIQLHSSVLKIRDVFVKNGAKAAHKIFEAETIPNLAKVRGNINLINSEAKKSIALLDEKLSNTTDSVKIAIIVVSALAFIVGIISGILIVRSILRQLGAEPTEVIDIVKKIAEGDFTGTLILKNNNEKSLLGYIKIMKDGLEKLISEVINSALNLSQSVDQISSGNQNLSQRTTEQASALEEMAATVEEATATIKQNADNAKEANTVSENTSHLADEGNAVMSETVTSINQISDSSKKIGAIISVINEIAFQTNLLALNAAVEAARAGDQGRGFAVVAGEVRNLAQRAGSAAKEISDLIKDSLDKVEYGTKLANSSGESLKKIVSAVKKVSELVNEIAIASEEQRRGMEQINTAVAGMDTMTQQNAALVEETASASEEMTSLAQELRTMMERFKIYEH